MSSRDPRRAYVDTLRDYAIVLLQDFDHYTSEGALQIMHTLSQWGADPGRCIREAPQVAPAKSRPYRIREMHARVLEHAHTLSRGNDSPR